MLNTKKNLHHEENREMGISRISILWMLATFVCVSAIPCHAEDKDSSEARKYIRKVFNDSYTIISNNASVRTKLAIDNCSLKYSMVIAGTPESQFCNLKYLDLKNINGGRGSVTIGTVNDERKISISTLNDKYWSLNLSYNSDKFTDEKKIIASLKKIIASCK